MSLRRRVRRSGVAFLIAGFVVTTLHVDPAAHIPAAFAEPATALVASPAPDASSDPEASPDPAASPDPDGSAPPKGPRGGDLTHLTFTATGALSAALVDPIDDGVAASNAAAIAVQTVLGAGVEVKVGGEVVPFARIGKRTVDVKTGVTTFTYYGVTLPPGPNEIALTPLGAAGLRGATTIHRVYGPGRPIALTLVASGPLRADGRSIDQLRVEGRDAWGHHAAAGEVVQVTLVSGDARLERTANATPAPLQTPVPMSSTSPGPNGAQPTRQTVGIALGADGSAILRLIPGLTPGEIVLQAIGGDASCEARVFLAPNPRKPFVNGLITAGAGAVPGIPDEPDDVADGTNSRRGRIALFGTGSVGNAVATFAYDTANTLERTANYAGAAATDPGDRPFAITGDTSVLRDDALSSDHLYARIDSGRASAQWGEFRATTDTSSSALGAFDQLVDGAKLDVTGGQARATVFVARNDVGYDRRVFAPSGLDSGVMLNPNIVVGSEIVLLATIDQRTGAILTQTALTNGVDYSIEYATGQMRFINVPLPFDSAFNPQEVVVTYEYDDPGSAAKTLGGHGEVAFGPNHSLKLAFGYVNDTSGAGNITLASEALSGTITGGSWSIVHATSSGSLLSTSADQSPTGGGGGAIHAQLTRTVGNDRLSLLFDQTGLGYSDPFGGLSTPGLLNESLTYDHKFAAGQGDLSLNVNHQGNVGIDGGASTTQTEAQLRVRRALGKRLTLNAEIDRTVATSSAVGPSLAVPTPAPSGSPSAYDAVPIPAQESTQVKVGADWRVTSAASLSVDRLETLGGVNTVEPSQTDAQLSYDLGKAGRIYARERWSAAPVESFADATQALTAGTGGTRSFELGIENRLGPATTVDSSWGVEHTGSGSDIYSAFGVQEKLNLGPVKGNAFVQDGTANDYNASGGGFNVYGLALSYADPSNRLRISASSQMRTGNGAGFSDTLGAAGALTPDLSLFASLNDARAAGTDEGDDKVGLAWRPSQSDFGVTLLQYERQTGSGSYNATDEGAVLSLEQVVRLRRRTEVIARYAYKVDGDSLYAAHSSLAGLRLDQTIGDHYDLGVEMRRSKVLGIDGADATAFAIEGGLRLGNQTRVGIGYNFSATADPSLALTPQHRGFYITITSVVDRLLGWGKP